MAAAEEYFKNIEAVHSGNLEVRLAENNEEIDNLLLEKAKNGLAERFQKFIYPNLNKNDSKEKISSDGVLTTQ